MAFFKFRKSSSLPDAPRAPGEAAPPETVESLRRRALYRLIGAAVLVIVAIVGFPLLFDTQPRPVAINAPIAIPDRDGAPPLTVSASGPVTQETQATTAQSPASPQVTATSSLSAGEEVVTATGAGASTPAAPRPPPPVSDNGIIQTPHATPPAGQPDKTRAEQDARAKQQAAARRDAEKRRADAKAQAQARAQRQRDQAADAARARALLEGQDVADVAANPTSGGEPARHDAKPSTAFARDASGRSDAAGGHYVIQIGAFADAQSTQTARQRAEHAGISVYTQNVTTSAGQRTRVRAGPFASRDEAERALAKLRQAGLGGSILSP